MESSKDILVLASVNGILRDHVIDVKVDFALLLTMEMLYDDAYYASYLINGSVVFLHETMVLTIVDSFLTNLVPNLVIFISDPLAIFHDVVLAIFQAPETLL